MRDPSTTHGRAITHFCVTRRQCVKLSVASISLPIHHTTSVICCQYQSVNAPHYFSYLLPISVYQCTTVLQLSVASICLPMKHITSVICCQYQSTNAPHYFSYLLPVPVYRNTTVFQLSVASISLTMHNSLSLICHQQQIISETDSVI